MTLVPLQKPQLFLLVMKQILTIPAIVFLWMATPCSAQKENNIWYFGKKVGIDFNSGTPIAINDGSLPAQVEGTSTISDSTGKLLFYTNGEAVWNARHDTMLNGYALYGHKSSTQAAVIIPKPGSNTLYYIFTTDDAEHNLKNGLQCSEVDMTLDGGLGGVIAATKNTLLDTALTEKLAAVRSYDGRTVWVITHEWGSDAFHVFQVTSSGVTSTPIISHIGSKHERDFYGYNAIGYMQVSPDGKRLALATFHLNVLELFDFDNSTGLISNPISLPSGDQEYGVCFSPDNSKLYVSSPSKNLLYQFDIPVCGGDSNSIRASKTLIANLNTYRALQRYRSKNLRN